MSTLPMWNSRAFGCLVRNSVSIESLMRTVLTASLPMPMISRTGDTQAPLELTFGLDMDESGFGAWQQWVTYDLADGVLPFAIYLNWGTQQPRVRARLSGGWKATKGIDNRWQVSGVMAIERESLPRFSGGPL